MKTAVVICPGRGTYNKGELGWLSRHFPDKEMLSAFDRIRTDLGQETLSALDGAQSFSISRHTRGDNASALIYAATLGDFLSLNREKVRIAAITGNSMGWYSALACAGAVTPQAGFEIANTMGRLMQEAMIGGQLVHPAMGADWSPDPARRAEFLRIVSTIAARPGHELHLSIDLGGMLVLAGNEAGLKAFEAAVSPVDGRFPMRLVNHAAFHTHLQEPVAMRGRELLPPELFAAPQLPLIDGRGAIWWPGASNSASLRDYTLGHQVTRTYDFSHAVRIAAREFAPDLFIVTGPGTTLGGAVIQSLIQAEWRGMKSKADFEALQKAEPLVISMGMAAQRPLVA